MVSRSPLPLDNRAWRRFTSTVIDDIWIDVLFFTLFATMVTAVSELTPHKLGISSQLVNFLGTVLGALVSFRVISAYTSYQDGRKLWTNITVGARNLAQMIWIHVPNQPKNEGSMNEKEVNEKVLQTILEKKSMINLIQAFAISVKHFLRGEPGVFYEDLYPLISFLPRYTNIGQHNADMLPLWATSHNSETQGPLPLNPTEADEGQSKAVIHEPSKGLLVEHISSSPTHHPFSLPPATQSSASLRSRDTLVDPSERPSLEISTICRNPTTGLSQPPIPASPIPNCKEIWISSCEESPASAHIKPHKEKTVDSEMGLPDVPCHRELGPAVKPPATTIYEYIPFFKLFRWVLRVIRKRDIAPKAMEHRAKRKKLEKVESNVPFEILMYLSASISELMQNGVAQPAVATSLMNGTALLQDTLSNLERIRNTPIPFAYQMHLRMTIWLYLLFAPFQIIDLFGWLTIPVLTFMSFLYLGFLEIGTQIEHPFSYEWNDLDVDGFCLAIHRELLEITAFTKPKVSSFINEWNHPFFPTDNRNAVDIKKSVDDKGQFMMDGVMNKSKHNTGTSDCDTDYAPTFGLSSIQRVFVSNWKISYENTTKTHEEV